MIADLKPDAEYKESGLPWLGAVPVTWEVRNLRALISQRAERDRADLPLLPVAREKGVFVRSLTDADQNHNVIPDDLRNYQVARAGNLVIKVFLRVVEETRGTQPTADFSVPDFSVPDSSVPSKTRSGVGREQ